MRSIHQVIAGRAESALVEEAFGFELDPNRAQRVMLAKSVGARRYIYNWGLSESLSEYKMTGQRPSLRELKTRLVELKKGECPWLYEVSAHIGQQALVDLDCAFVRFFKGLQGCRGKSGFPRFKKKSGRDAARLYGVEISERHIRLPLIGRVRLKGDTNNARLRRPDPLCDDSTTGGSMVRIALCRAPTGDS
jgi:putative transposase